MRLAGLYGVQTSYRDIAARRVHAPEATIVALLRALGAPIESASDAAGAVTEAERTRLGRCLEPVLVAWNGLPPAVTARFLRPRPPRRLAARIQPWDPEEGLCGDPIRFTPRAVSVAAEGGGCRATFRLPGPLRSGYHLFTLRAGGLKAESLVISAPAKAPSPRAGAAAWGGFLPLHALRSRRNWGVGDFTDLADLSVWLGRMGGAYLGTLPLQSAFLDEPMDCSPYAPASRLFLNELHLDVEALPEFEASAAARKVASGSAFRTAIEAFRKRPLVDHRGVMALKRAVLEPMCDTLWRGSTARARAFRRLWREELGLLDYARFRAAGERLRAAWQSWPEPLRGGRISRADFDAGAERYHVYAQWAAREQFSGAAREAARAGVGFYLDFPLGVHASSYDTYRMRDLFMAGVGVGAPPDSFFEAGQSWGFQPIHPGRLRESGYAYFVSALRKLMAHATALRVDHVMGFHRLFCVPDGAPATEGTYVRYPVEELYAILTLEASRAGCLVIGEDLGVVPAEVRTKMSRHGLRRTYVMEMESSADAERPLPEPPRRSLACLNTHDMPTFASFWTGADVAWREAHRHLDRAGAARERRRRAAIRNALVKFFVRKGLSGKRPGVEEALRACLHHLATSRAETLLVNLEDLWLEMNPQNVPGTWKEYPNWRRKARVRMEEMRRGHPAAERLEEVERLRRSVRSAPRARPGRPRSRRRGGRAS